MIPERGIIYDFCFEKKGTGTWVEWLDTIDKSSMAIPADAKVNIYV